MNIESETDKEQVQVQVGNRQTLWQVACPRRNLVDRSATGAYIVWRTDRTSWILPPNLCAPQAMVGRKSYADLVALAQFLPGPASGQVGIGVGMMRAGIWGGIVAWQLHITVRAHAYDLRLFDANLRSRLGRLDSRAENCRSGHRGAGGSGYGRKAGLRPVRAAIALIAMAVVLLWQSPISQVTVIALAGISGLWLFKRQANEEAAPEIKMPIGRRAGLFAWACLLCY